MAEGSDSSEAPPVVVALGGNTLLGEERPWTVEDQRERVDATVARIADLVRAGTRVVLTHGNGPQVGSLLLQQEQAPDTPQLPLDVLVAETQAQIGYMLQQSLDNELAGTTDFVTVVTQVVVDPEDPAFDDPTKPVGPFYTEREAEERPFETREVGSGERPFRRVVPSPDPVDLVETDAIRRLVDRGDRVVCAGGGGVPVVREERLRGVEAVVDKDLTSRLLATDLGANVLVLLTDVECAYVNFGEPDQRPLGAVDAADLRAHLESGEFGEGSMEPKVRACLEFVEAGGELAVVTSPDHLEAALDGEAGTRVSG